MVERTDLLCETKKCDSFSNSISTLFIKITNFKQHLMQVIGVCAESIKVYPSFLATNNLTISNSFKVV